MNNDKLISDELIEDERILWSGKPNHKKVFSKQDVYLVPFSIIWLLGALIWELLAVLSIKENITILELFFPCVGSVFVLFGLYFSFGRLIYKRYKKKNTYYAITDSRVMILVNGKRVKITSILIRDVEQFSKESVSNGKGIIIFNKANSNTFKILDTGMECLSSHRIADLMIFYDVENIDYVYKLIISTKKHVC